jgi:hypothetical protein
VRLSGRASDGIFSGTPDEASGEVNLAIVALDDIGCITYDMTGTVDGDGDRITGGFDCTSPLTFSDSFAAVPASRASVPAARRSRLRLLPEPTCVRLQGLRDREREAP